LLLISYSGGGVCRKLASSDYIGAKAVSNGKVSECRLTITKSENLLPEKKLKKETKTCTKYEGL